jgi:hypothetical protein
MKSFNIVTASLVSPGANKTKVGVGVGAATAIFVGSWTGVGKGVGVAFDANGTLAFEQPAETSTIKIKTIAENHKRILPSSKFRGSILKTFIGVGKFQLLSHVIARSAVCDEAISRLALRDCFVVSLLAMTCIT